MKYILLLVSTLCCMAIISCDHKSHSHSHKNTHDNEQLGKEYTSQYVCPMHCEGSGSDAEGTCPVCGMEYVINKDYNSQEHKGDSHDHKDHEEENHNHDGHDHDGHNH